MVYLNPQLSRLVPMNKFWLGWVIGLLFLIGGPNQLNASGGYSQFCLPPDDFRLSNQSFFGITLPHHEVASQVWQPSFNQLSQQSVKRVILLSPNHFWLGKQSITVASQPAKQDNLNLILDNEVVANLVRIGFIEDQPDIVWQDHGVTNFIPLIKSELPEVKVVPMLTKKNISQKQIDYLVNLLTPYLDDHTVVIASLDFAHDVTPLVALKNDRATQHLIQHRNYSQLVKLPSTHIDSPASLVTFLKLMDAKKANTRLVWRSHTGEFYRDCVSETTSYQIWLSSSE